LLASSSHALAAFIVKFVAFHLRKTVTAVRYFVNHNFVRSGCYIREMLHEIDDDNDDDDGKKTGLINDVRQLQ